MLDWIIVVGQKSYRRPRHRLQKISGSRPAFGFLERKLENKIKTNAEANIYIKKNIYLPKKRAEEIVTKQQRTKIFRNLKSNMVYLFTLTTALY